MTNKDILRGYRVTVTMTAHQAIEAAHALQEAGVTQENGRLFSASSRIVNGLIDAGWEWQSTGGEDEPGRGVWKHE